MLKEFSLSSSALLPETWYLDFPPALVTVHSVKTGRQVREPSLVAVARSRPDRLTAVGSGALSYKDNPDMLVFSPLRRGQIAQYPAAQALIKALLKQAGCGAVTIPKPVLCVRVQEHTTQVEEQALGEAAIQSGARQVLFYTGSFSAMLDCARDRKDLKHAVIIHIDPQD